MAAPPKSKQGARAGAGDKSSAAPTPPAPPPTVPPALPPAYTDGNAITAEGGATGGGGAATAASGGGASGDGAASEIAREDPSAQRGTLMALGFTVAVVDAVLGRDGSARAPLESLVEQCLNFVPDRETPTTTMPRGVAVAGAGGAAVDSLLSNPAAAPASPPAVAAPAPAAPARSSNPQTSMKQWKCEYCEFVDPDFDACCAHEEACLKNPDANPDVAAKAAKMAAAAKDFAAAKAVAGAERAAAAQAQQSCSSGSGAMMQAWRCEFCEHVGTSFDEVTKHEVGCSKRPGGGGDGGSGSSGSEYETDSDEERLIQQEDLDTTRAADMLLLGVGPEVPDVVPKCPDGHLMPLSSYAKGPYKVGWYCDKCGGAKAKSNARKIPRNFCMACKVDYCKDCAAVIAEFAKLKEQFMLTAQDPSAAQAELAVAANNKEMSDVSVDARDVELHAIAQKLVTVPHAKRSLQELDRLRAQYSPTPSSNNVPPSLMPPLLQGAAEEEEEEEEEAEEEGGDDEKGKGAASVGGAAAGAVAVPKEHPALSSSPPPVPNDVQRLQQQHGRSSPSILTALDTVPASIKEATEEEEGVDGKDGGGDKSLPSTQSDRNKYPLLNAPPLAEAMQAQSVKAEQKMTKKKGEAETETKEKAASKRKGKESKEVHGDNSVKMEPGTTIVNPTALEAAPPSDKEAPAAAAAIFAAAASERACAGNDDGAAAAAVCIHGNDPSTCKYGECGKANGLAPRASAAPTSPKGCPIAEIPTFVDMRKAAAAAAVVMPPAASAVTESARLSAPAPTPASAHASATAAAAAAAAKAAAAEYDALLATRVAHAARRSAVAGRTLTTADTLLERVVGAEQQRNLPRNSPPPPPLSMDVVEHAELASTISTRTTVLRARAVSLLQQLNAASN